MFLRISLIVLPILLSACAGPQLKDTKQIEMQAKEQAQSANDSLDNVFERVRGIQVEAQKEDLYFFSPNYMTSAESAMSQAESALNANKQSLAMTEALKAEAFYKRGLAIKPMAQQQLSDVFAGMQMLRELSSDKRLPSDFQDIQADIKDTIGLIEQGKTAKVTDEQEGLLDDIKELEVDTLLLIYFNPVESALEKAEDTGAEDFAVQSYAEAEQATGRLETLINQQPKQREQIKADSQNAIRLAQHARHVSQAAKPLLQLDPESAEQHILSIERFLSRIGSALGEKDVTHLPLDSQSIALAQTAEILAKQAKSKLEQQLQQNQTQKENQKLQQRINELEKLLNDMQSKAKVDTTTTAPVIEPEKDLNGEPPSAEKNTDKPSETQAIEDSSTTKPIKALTESNTITADSTTADGTKEIKEKAESERIQVPGAVNTVAESNTQVNEETEESENNNTSAE